MPTKPTKNTYTISEASKKLKISRQAVHEAIQKGLLKAEQGDIVQVTRGWLITADSIKAYKPSKSHKQRGKKLLSLIPHQAKGYRGHLFLKGGPYAKEVCPLAEC